MSKVIEEIAAERRRQVESEGWDSAHDDEHIGGELAGAAACYALHSFGEGYNVVDTYMPPLFLWPWSVNWWKPTTPRRNLIKAAALIVAEIERLDRAEAKDRGGRK